jgi:hypothetical protein
MAKVILLYDRCGSTDLLHYAGVCTVHFAGSFTLLHNCLWFPDYLIEMLCR